MEKPAVKAKNKFLALLPKAAASLRFENPLFSPGRDKRANSNALTKYKPHHHQNRGYSGPITSSFFQQARSKSKNSSFSEPTSPTISCIGQIKYKKKLSLKKQISSLPKEYGTILPPDPKKKNKINDLKKKALKNSRNIFNSFTMKSSDGEEGRKSDASSSKRVPDRAPGLSQMKRFASSRDTLSNFDWTASQVAPKEKYGEGYNRKCYSDDEGGGYSDGEEEEEEIEGIVPYSKPLEPKKEINLWKRRTMAQPKPLQLNIHHGK